MSRILIIFGAMLILLGFLWPFLKKLGLGQLPGDFLIKRDGFTFYFPIVTCLILSLIFTIVMWFFRR